MPWHAGCTLNTHLLPACRRRSRCSAPIAVPAAVAVLARAVLAVVALILHGIPLGVAALLGVLRVVAGVAAVLTPLFSPAVTVRSQCSSS